MAFISILQNRPSCIRGSGIRVYGDLTYSSAKSHGINRRSVLIRISKSLAKKARFIVGDRVSIMVDSESGLALIKRDLDSPWSLSFSGSNSKKSGNLTMKFTYHKEYGVPLIIGAVACDNVEVSDEGILFQLPKQD